MVERKIKIVGESIGFVAWCGYKYVWIWMKNTSGIRKKFGKHKKWKYNRKQSLGIPVFLCDNAMVIHDKFK